MARTGPRRCDADHRSGGARIPKDGGGERQLGIPNVLDRLIQQAISQVLTLIFDPGFSESSFGFRPGRSAHGAAKRLRVDGRRLTVRTSPLPLTLNHRPSTINLFAAP